MYSNYDANKLIDQFNQIVNEKSKKLLRYFLTAIVGLGLLLVLIIYATLNNTDAMIIVSVFGGLILIGLITVVFFSKIIPSNNTTYNFLYPQIYQKINEDLALELKYQTKNKVDNSFVQAGGIFNRQVRVHVYRNLSGKTENNNDFKIFDCMLITGGGQYQQVHLNGIYLFTKVNTDLVLQIRTNGKPQTKKYDFKKIEEVTDYKVYLEQNQSLDSVTKVLLQKLRELKIKLNAKHIYLGINEGILHLAYNSKDNKRMQRNLDQTKINRIYQRFLSEIQLIDELVNIFNY